MEEMSQEEKDKVTSEMANKACDEQAKSEAQNEEQISTDSCGDNHQWKRGMLPGSIPIRTCKFCLIAEKISPEVWANTPA